MLNSKGLVSCAQANLDSAVARYSKDQSMLEAYGLCATQSYSLEQVVAQVRPTILIGVSGQAASFSEKLVRKMAQHVDRPIIFPLSNPTSHSEAAPEDLILWTEGRALIATGSPFAPVSYGGKEFRITQCNNSLIFLDSVWALWPSAATRSY